jgi:hypothetical protein
LQELAESRGRRCIDEGWRTLRSWNIKSNFPNFPNFPGIKNAGKFADPGEE